MRREDFEIMAPAGSFESLMAAIQGGADSVYFGAGELNMRSRSSANFSVDDLGSIAKICRENGIKSYLTLNIVLFDEDLPEMRKMVDAAVNCGISAVIASDQAAIYYARSRNIEVHVSTQVNISNFETLKFYSKYADVVVLARELNLEQVGKIYNLINEERIVGPGGNLVRIEMFVHGALCMATSGKCYLSLHQHNFSANRGGCLQPCRRGYIVTDKDSGNELEIDNQYIMSPKDLKTIHFLDKVVDAGVRVFKIEGRARGPEYVKTVTRCYNEAINAIISTSYNEAMINEWDRRLMAVFNRGFWDGYYLGQKVGEWSANYGNLASERKIYIAKGTNFFPKIRVAEFLMEAADLKIGDKIMITGPTTGVVEAYVSELRLDLKSANMVKKGDKFSIPIDAKIRRADKMYKIVDPSEIKTQ